jgi:fatty-acyl-CoA synthase
MALDYILEAAAVGTARLQPDCREPPFTPSLLVTALNREPSRPTFYLDDGRSLTAAEVRDTISRYVRAFAELGITARSRIGVLSGNRPEVLYVTSAALIADLCVVPLHPMGSIDDFAFIVEDAALETLVFDPEGFEGKVGGLQAIAPRLKRLLALGASKIAIDLPRRASFFAPTPLVAPKVRGDDVCRISYSGGTTGKPKGVMNTYEVFRSMLMIQLLEWEWPRDIRHLVCTPLSHTGISAYLPTLLRGGSIVVLPRFEPVAVMAAIQEYRISSTMLVPMMIYALLDHPRFGEFDLSSLETVFYGGSSMSPIRLRTAIERMGRIFFQFYAQAEAPMTVTALKKGEHDPTDLTRLASCGRPVPWLDVALLDERGDEVAVGQPGEICIRGPIVMAGYLNKPRETAEALADRWLHTGDVAIRDAAGFLTIVDRKKDMIITGGFNVYSREVEDVLCSHPAVAQAAAIGVPDPKWGEAVKAVVVLRPNMQVAADELIALVREKKGSVQSPKTVDFVGSIPMTSVAKPDKKALRALYGSTPPISAAQ